MAARNALVEANLYLVAPIAAFLHRKLPPSFELQDLLATGYLALLHIATRYRPREHGGAPFSAFARPRIRGAILDSVRRRHWEESTRPPLDDGPEPAIDPRIEINTSIDERALRERLNGAIARLPPRPKREGRYQSYAAALAESAEWRAAAGHVEAIAAMRREIKKAS